MATRMRVFCWVLLATVSPDLSAARSKHSKTAPQTVYDQKQTGDYNIQLHLKDIQIIALLGEDAGVLGDYDYNYDYSDFTVKPGTHKPTSESTPSSTPSPPPSSSSVPQKKPSSTLKPTNHPYPILAPSTTQRPKEKPLIPDPKPVNHTDKPNHLAVTLNEVDKTEKPANGSDLIASTEKIELQSSTTKKTDVEETNSPGKIKVQIIETPVGVVPGEEGPGQNSARPGEIVHLRRCSTGYARDKKGRCRRIRRPGTSATSPLTYGFGRLASNLVSRFRHASPDTSSSSESTED